MKEDLSSGKFLNTTNYKIWSIAYEITDPETQIEMMKHLISEVIDETCKVCAENAYAKPVSTITEGGHLMELWTVNEDSILNCAEILKKQIG